LPRLAEELYFLPVDDSGDMSFSWHDEFVLTMGNG
jgi:hypothetical protein